MKPLKALGLLLPLALAGGLSAQVLYTFDSSVEDWTATEWADGVQTVAWDAATQSLAATIDSGGWRYLANLYGQSDYHAAAYDAFNAGFANPTMSTFSFDITVAPGTGGSYFNLITVLTGEGADWGASQQQWTMFNQAELAAGATKTFFMDFTLDQGTTGVATGADNYQLVLGANSDWSGGTIYIDNVRIQPAAIPEPSTYAALLGAGAIGLAVWRRRRRA